MHIQATSQESKRNQEMVLSKLDNIITSVDEQRVWFDTKLCSLERRMDKVERGNERIVGCLQQVARLPCGGSGEPPTISPRPTVILNHPQTCASSRDLLCDPQSPPQPRAHDPTRVPPRPISALRNQATVAGRLQPAHVPARQARCLGPAPGPGPRRALPESPLPPRAPPRVRRQPSTQGTWVLGAATGRTDLQVGAGDGRDARSVSDGSIWTDGSGPWYFTLFVETCF